MTKDAVVTLELTEKEVRAVSNALATASLPEEDIEPIRSVLKQLQLPETVYECDCGRKFTTQKGYAGHQNFCETDGDDQ